MKISGFSFIRNGIKFDYPFIESIQSILSICDEFVIAVGKSEDDTLERIIDLKEPKIKIINTVWDENIRTGGSILAQQTDIALSQITGDWGIYLQADEVIHEKYLPIITESMHQYLEDRRVEGLLFKYIHFYGNYDYYANSRDWYRREIRIIRNRIGVHSWKDAQGFRINGRKMNVKPIEAYIYHYGWVKQPKIMQDKVRSFHKLWHNDEWIDQKITDTKEFDYSKIDEIKKFKGEHPAVMNQRIKKYNWDFNPPQKSKKYLKNILLNWIEKIFKVRIGEYKNFKIIK